MTVALQVFSITVPAEQESAARQLVCSLSPNARLTYSVGGTLKFELPSDEVRCLRPCVIATAHCYEVTWLLMVLGQICYGD